MHFARISYLQLARWLAGSLAASTQAPWCGHCKQLAPKYASAAEVLAAEGITNAILASVDCTVETELASRFHIEGYPTLLAFKRDATAGIPYNGAREVDALVAFLKKKSAPAVSTITSAADLDVRELSLSLSLSLSISISPDIARPRLLTSAVLASLLHGQQAVAAKGGIVLFGGSDDGTARSLSLSRSCSRLLTHRRVA